MIHFHLHFTMMQCVEIFVCYVVLAQINAFFLIVWIKLLALIKSFKVVLVNSLGFERLTVFVINHKVEYGYLIGYRIAQIYLY